MLMKEYFGLTIDELTPIIVRHRTKLLKTAKPGQHNKLKEKRGIFNQCEMCDRWVPVTKEYFDPDGKSYWSPLMTALDDSGRNVCSSCWDILDVAKYGPYNGYTPYPSDVQIINNAFPKR